MAQEFNEWSEDLQQAIYIAHGYAKENFQETIMPAHLLKALLHKDVGLIPFLESLPGDKDYYYLQEWADIQIGLYPRSSKVSGDIVFSDASQAVLSEAEDIKLKLESEKITPICLLASLATPGVGFSYEQLKTLTLTAGEIIESSAKAPSSKTGGGSAATGSGRTTSAKSIGKYCINKNEMTITPVIGFENEIAVLYEVMARKTKSNILITGESGVGKTALVNGFVQRLTAADVPAFLKDAIVYELDLAAITSDANYKGEAEDRLKNVFEELRSTENAILVIESVEKLMDKNGTLYGSINAVKKALNEGNMILICTSSIDGYTKNIETDKEFVRKFEKITIEEPNADFCFRILKGAVPVFEEYHGLTIADDVIHDAIRLAKRYMTEKAMPDSVFDLIDRTMALIRTTNDMSGKDITAIRKKLTDLQSNASKSDEKKLKTELTWIHYEIFNKLSGILVSQIDDETDFAKIEKVKDRFICLFSILDKLEPLAQKKYTSVESSALYAVIARQTGIPMGKVQSKERDKLSNAETTLKKRVVGQDHAVKIVLDAVYESRSGLNKKGQPMGSFFFLGPTGTGKTELAKALAEFLFQDESAMLRFDMSEYKEEHSVALLYGAPPGYVGYEEGGLLVNQIRQKPYSVVLFDEIEKAHRSVFDLFLQILDEGKLHDRLGRVGDFSNALILFTSNIGSQFIIESFQKEIIPQNNQLLEIMQGHFRPEFLGRLTEIIPFSPITEKIVTMIFDIHLKGLLKLLEEQNITLTIDDEAKRTVAMSGFNAQFGARPIIGIIRKELRRPLSKMIISGKIKSGDKVALSIKDGNIEFNVS